MAPVFEIINAKDQRPVGQEVPPKQPFRLEGGATMIGMKNESAKLEEILAFTEQYPFDLGKKLDQSYLPASNSHMELNKTFSAMFIERLKQIDRDLRGDMNLKLVTYKDWVDMLLRLNDAIIRNLASLESEVTERLTLIQRHTNNAVNGGCRYSQGNELAMARKDLATLTKIIQNAYYRNQWDDLHQHQFETLTLAEVFGADAVDLNTVKPQCCTTGLPPPSESDFALQHNKLLLNVKALAFEVAEKHDEVRDLQKQIISLEDEIQKAYLKIQLKDDVIKELRLELKTTNQKLSEHTNKKMTDMESMTESNHETEESRNTDNNSSVEESSMEDAVSECSGRTTILASSSNANSTNTTPDEGTSRELLDQFMELASKSQLHNDRNLDICQRAEREKREAYRKLDYLRNQLVDIEAISVSADSGMCESNDTDGRIIDSIRRRIFNLKECSQQLNKQVQRLAIENDQLTANLAQEKTLFERVCCTMKELADHLISMTGHDLDFNHLFDNNHSKNPFLEPILALKTMANTREDELRDKLNERNDLIKSLQNELQALKKNKKSEIKELSQQNTDLSETIAKLERDLEDKLDELDKQDEIIRQLSSKKCQCPKSQSSAVTPSGTSSATAEQINCQISHFESELANANKIIEDLRIELTKRNEILAGSCHRDTELETYQVECNRLHKINQALTHEICRSSACRNALERAKECIYAMHVEMARLHQHEAQMVEAVRKECELEVKHYRERYDEISKELNEERDQKSKLTASLRQANKEQADSKRKNAELLTELQKLRSLFDVQRKTYENLLEKHETLSNNFDVQSTSLHGCHKQIAQLQERFFELEKINKTDEVETRLLRDEVIYFKREISNLQSQLKLAEECKLNFINKIEHLHMIINEQHKKLQIAEVAHKQIVDDLQRAKTEVSSRFDVLSQQYQSLDENYSQKYI